MDGQPSIVEDRPDVYPLALQFFRWVDVLIATGALRGCGLSEVQRLDDASRSVVTSIEQANGTTSTVAQCRSLDRSCGAALACVACLEKLAAHKVLEPPEVAEGKVLLARILSALGELSDSARARVQGCVPPLS